MAEEKFACRRRRWLTVGSTAWQGADGYLQTPFQYIGIGCQLVTRCLNANFNAALLPCKVYSQHIGSQLAEHMLCSADGEKQRHTTADDSVADC